jgi:ketosteroid isomerase-like protein
MARKRTLLRAAFGTLLAVGILLMTGLLHSQQPNEAVRTSILAILTAQQTAWNQGNIREFMDGYWNSPNLTFAGGKGFTRGWEPVLARYERTYTDKAAMGTLEFSELEIRPLGSEAALVLGKWHLQRQAGDIGGIFTLVMQKFPEGWRIIHDHTTQSPPETK